jgi:hypothetical protein
MTVDLDTQEPNQLRVRWSQISNINNNNITTSPSSPRKAVGVVVGSGGANDHDNDNRTERKWSLRSLQILLFWAIAKSKMRYLLGLYTFLITVRQEE